MRPSIWLSLLALLVSSCTRTVTCAEEPGHSFCDDAGARDAGSDGGGDGDAGARDAGPRDGGEDASAADAGTCGACDAGRCVDGECVACAVATEAIDCRDPTPYCGEAGECVACRDDDDCGGATPVCVEDVCRGCEGDGECAARTETPVCDEPSGACVGCLDEGDCSGNVCHPVDRTCTALAARELTQCQPCTFDAECRAGRLCVETSFTDPAPGVVGSFCLWERSAPLPGPNGTCALASRPFAGTLVTTSVDGAPADVCTLRSTTCPAFLQHAVDVSGCDVPFTDDSACGDADFNDGRCRMGGETLCTYPCLGTDDRDCPSGSACVDVGGDRYCAI